MELSFLLTAQHFNANFYLSSQFVLWFQSCCSVAFAEFNRYLFWVRRISTLVRTFILSTCFQFAFVSICSISIHPPVSSGSVNPDDASASLLMIMNVTTSPYTLLIYSILTLLWISGMLAGPRRRRSSPLMCSWTRGSDVDPRWSLRGRSACYCWNSVTVELAD